MLIHLFYCLSRNCRCMENIVRLLCLTFTISVFIEHSFVACLGMISSRWYGSSQDSEDSSDDTITEAAQRAEAGILNNKITFPVTHGSGPQNVVSQFSVGETVALSCTGETQQGDTAANYIWKHNTKIIQPGLSPATSDYRYTVNNVGNTNFLYLHNITFYDSGTIECFKRCRNGTNEFCLKKVYTLRPNARRLQDVFEEPLKNVTVSRARRPVSFTCGPKLRCVPDTDPYFIWKYDGVFLSVPVDHPLYHSEQPLNSDIHTGYVYNVSKPDEERPYCQETITLTADWANQNAGTAECWVRADKYSDEWFVQKSQVQFQ